MVRKFRKLAEITPSQWFILAQLILFSFAATVALTVVGLSRAVGLMARCAVKPWFSSFPVLHGRQEIARLSELVELATRATHGERRCLPRSLLLFWLLNARGEPVRLLIGVSKAASTFKSHAWIETEGKVIGDSPEMTGRFVTLLQL
jgi:hypothetical protein